VFTFRPECCSESQRNGVQLQTGIAFTFDRIPQMWARQRNPTGSVDECIAIYRQLTICGRALSRSRISELDSDLPTPLD
jgi:hypothetical protein